MQWLVHLGFLKQIMSPYSSPIMLIAIKNVMLKRIITDFRFSRVNLAFPLIRDSFAISESLECECFSIRSKRCIPYK